MKYYFIINSAAGKGDRVEELAENIRTSCTQRDVTYEIYHTSSVGDASIFVKQICADTENLPATFYACGGDGTLGEVVNGAAGVKGASVGVIPIGTGNDFVRNFNSDPAFFDIEAQIDGSSLAIDLLRCNDRFAINMVNIGFDCEVVKKTVKIKRHPMIPSKMAYVAGVISTLAKKPTLRTNISLDGNESVERHFLLTTFANGAFCGGGFHSNPYAAFCDGYIDALLINNLSRTKFIALVGSYKKGTHITEKNKHILSHSKHKKINLTFPEERSISIDGEIENIRELCIEIAEKALSFIVPKGAHALPSPVEAAAAL